METTMRRRMVALITVTMAAAAVLLPPPVLSRATAGAHVKALRGCTRSCGDPYLADGPNACQGM